MAVTGYGRRVRCEMMKVAVNTTPTNQNPTFLALCTVNPGDAGAANNSAGTTEPSSTGSYARQAVTWVAIPTYTGVTADTAVNTSNVLQISWTSTAAWSTGATALSHVGLYDTATLATVAETNYYGRAAISVPQAVNASGITLTIAASGLVMGCISA